MNLQLQQIRPNLLPGNTLQGKRRVDQFFAFFNTCLNVLCSLNFWFRAKGKLSDDQALHRCVVAFASDLIFLQVALNPHRKQGMKASSVSIDHAFLVLVPIMHVALSQARCSIRNERARFL